jgi:glycosyltransferase involved in cell wall biosynthesis
MRVLIAAASFASGISGIQRHALNVAQCLLLRAEISELHFVIAPWQVDLAERAGLPSDMRLRTHIAEMGRSSVSRNFWYYYRLPELAAQVCADLVHFSYPMPVNAGRFRCPTVVTLHDLYPYEIPMNFGFPKYLFHRIILGQCLRAVDAIACVSEATRLRLRQYAPITVRQKGLRIHNCVQADTHAALEPLDSSGRYEPFLLCVAQHRRNKNIATLIRAFERLHRFDWVDIRTRLIVVGMRGPETSSIHSLAHGLGLGGKIDFLEDLPEPKLQWCYRHCEALIAPSITEGFGLPVAEGILAGCRIVCSDIPAHREVGDGGCRFVSMGDNADVVLAAAIADSLNEPKRQPGNLPHLSAPVLAEQYLGLYKRLIASAAHPRNAGAEGLSNTPHSEPIAVAAPECDSALTYRGS